MRTPINKNSERNETITKVSTVWATPEGDKLVALMARVSNPNATLDDPSERLISYLIRHQHWSPFEMVNLCVEIECPRDISRQILRHKSFSFQEFSGRYAVFSELLAYREPRLQDRTNRQNSLPCADEKLRRRWDALVEMVRRTCFAAYDTAIQLGIAREVARVLLPEGLVPTKMYMNGTVRSWIHYINIRTGPETQKEHRDVALAIKAEFVAAFPRISAAVGYREAS